MVHFVRIENEKVVEEIDLPEGVDPKERYHSSLEILRAPVSVKPGWTWDGQNFKAPLQIAPGKEDLIAYARMMSYQKRISGTEHHGIFIPTDGDTLSLINGLKMLADAQPERLFNFDSPAGPITLTAEQANDLAMVVGNFVQSTFDRRAEVLSAIEAGDITSFGAVDNSFSNL